MIPYAIEEGKDLKTFAKMSQVSELFLKIAANSVRCLDLIGQVEKSPYRHTTFHAYILHHQIPLKFPQLQALSLHFGDNRDIYYDFKETTVKLENPETYLDLKKTLSVGCRDWRLNTLNVVDAGMQSLSESMRKEAEKEPFSYENSPGYVAKAIACMGGQAHIISSKRRILNQDHDLMDIKYDEGILVNSMIACIPTSLATLTSLSIVLNEHLGSKKCRELFLKALPETLQHLSFFPPKSGAFDSFNVSDLHEFHNLHNLKVLDLCWYNRVGKFEGWDVFSQLTSLTYWVEGSSSTDYDGTAEKNLVKNLPTLRFLQVCGVKGDALPYLQGLDSLDSLSIVDSTTNDADLLEILKMTQLNRVKFMGIHPYEAPNQFTVSRNCFTQEGLEAFKEVLKERGVDFVIEVGSVIKK